MNIIINERDKEIVKAKIEHNNKKIAELSNDYDNNKDIVKKLKSNVEMYEKLLEEMEVIGNETI